MKLKYEHLLSIATFICAFTSLVIRIKSSNEQTNIYLEHAPAFQTQGGEWKIGYWPQQINLLSVDQVLAEEKKKNPNITEADIRNSIAQNEFTPPALPIEVKYTDFAFSKNYKITTKESEKKP